MYNTIKQSGTLIMKSLRMFIINVINFFPLRLIKGKKELKDFKQHCHNYFMEVVSSLCFGGQTTPEPSLINMLMKMMFSEEQSIIASSSDRKLDAVPVITSSLLQLLLEHK